MPRQSNQVRSFQQSLVRDAVEAYAITHPLRRAIARARQTALGAHHALTVFRPDPGRDGYLFATCPRCGAGATIHFDTGCLNLSHELEEVCPQGTSRLGEARRGVASQGAPGSGEAR